MQLFHIRHVTQYNYSGFVIDSASQIKLYPIQDDYQRISEHRLQISQHPVVHTIKDYFGNTTGFFSIIAPHRQLVIESLAVVEILPKSLPTLNGAKEVWEKVRGEEIQLEFHDFLRAEQAICQAEVLEAIDEILDKDQHPLDTILELSAYIYTHFEYKKGVTTVETSVEEIWELKAGVCQDFAHLLLYMVRLMGIPCRYMSGYICPGSSEWRGEGATHAWIEVWLPDTGWVGIDPTNKCMVEDRHVRIATGRNFSDCTPVKGTYKGASEHQLEVTVHFGTKAFTDAELALQVPTYTSQSNIAEGVPKNSYWAYLQMQQQQQ